MSDTYSLDVGPAPATLDVVPTEVIAPVAAAPDVVPTEVQAEAPAEVLSGEVFTPAGDAVPLAEEVYISAQTQAEIDMGRAMVARAKAAADQYAAVEDIVG